MTKAYSTSIPVSSPAARRRTSRKSCWRLQVQTGLALVLAMGCSVSVARAQVVAATLPTGGAITHGSGTISQSGAAMRIEQHSATLIANWDSFSIGSDASVTFAQPDANSLALNRVVTDRPSEILGRLSANGHVMLINPAGILVGKTGRVDVGSLTASTLNLSDTDVLDGNGVYAFKGDNGGAVRNFGTISALQGGLVALLAPVIENHGQIDAPGGTALLTGASEVELDLGGNGLVSLRVNKGALDAAVSNGGIVAAAGGLVVLTAKGVDALSRAAVNNSGIVEAKGLSRDGGRILLGGGAGIGAGTDVSNSGRLDASSDSAKGGAITIEGDSIALSGTARIDVSGEAGGGTVLVGGSWQNGDPSVHQATSVSIAVGSVIDASARGSGGIVAAAGGTIAVWSDIHNVGGLTEVAGTLLARGGASGGDGGRIETSGYRLKVDGIAVSTLAARGKTGEWLLDPYNITIGSSGDTVSGNYTANVPGSLIDVATLMTALSSSNVTVSTGLAGSAGAEAGTITVNSAIGATANALELKAASSIVLNADITRSGAAGGLTLRAGTGTLVLGGGTKLSLAHGTTLANNISLTAGGATIDFAPLEVEYLVVGGGSGARAPASGYAAGGGGGAALSGSTLLTNSNSYAITVGAGGAYGLVGAASSGFGITANPGTIPAALGVGGTSGSGFTGGISIYDGSGGGGAGGAGGNGTSNTASSRKTGYGGIGINSSISGAVIGYGGGGAGAYASTWTAADTAASGAAYGGGTPGQSGAANRGGGGSGSAGAGGSGVVVARYVGPDATAGGVETAFTGDGTIGVDGVNYQVRSFNSSGTLKVDNLAASLTGAISGSGNLTLNASNGTMTLSGANSYTGATDINAGKVTVTSASGLGNDSAVSIANAAGAQLELLNTSATPAANPLAVSIGSLAGGGANGGALLIGANATALTGGNNGSTGYAGTISGSGAFEKNGTGTFTLTGSYLGSQLAVTCWSMGRAALAAMTGSGGISIPAA